MISRSRMSTNNSRKKAFDSATEAMESFKTILPEIKGLLEELVKEVRVSALAENQPGVKVNKKNALNVSVPLEITSSTEGFGRNGNSSTVNTTTGNSSTGNASKLAEWEKEIANMEAKNKKNQLQTKNLSPPSPSKENQERLEKFLQENNNNSSVNTVSSVSTLSSGNNNGSSVSTLSSGNNGSSSSVVTSGNNNENKPRNAASLPAPSKGGKRKSRKVKRSTKRKTNKRKH